MQVLLLLGQLDVVLPEEENVRVIQECSAVELAPVVGVTDRISCTDDLTVDLPHHPGVLPVETCVAAYAAVFDKAEGRHERHSASEDHVISAPLSQELHSPVHPRAAAFPVMPASRCRPRSSAVEEVKLDKFEAPFVEDLVENALHVIADSGFVYIQREEAAPVAACVPRFAVMLKKPVRMVFEQF